MDESEIIEQLIQILELIESSGEEISFEEEQELLSIVTDIVGSIQQPSALQKEPAEETEIPEGIPNSPVLSSPSGLLWILAGGNENAFIDYMRTFPDPTLNAIARNPAEIQSLINQYKATITQAHGEVSEGIPKADLNSSNIFGFAYDPRSGALKVKFQGNGAYGQGPIYQYQGVPPQIFKMFKDGAVPAKTNGSNKWGSWWVGKRPSIAGTFWALIRDKFPYSRIS